MRKVEAVLFDFDGTLIDSMKIVLDTLNGVLRGKGFSEIDPEDLMTVAGRPLIEILTAKVGGMDLERADECQREFFDLFQKVSLTECKPIPGALETLETLASRGLRLAVVSSSPKPIVERDLDRFGMRKLFHIVLTREDVKNNKPAPDILLMATQLLGVPPSRCLYVGDSPIDARAGKAAGIWTVGVLTGLSSEERLRREGLETIFKSVAHLPKLL